MKDVCFSSSYILSLITVAMLALISLGVFVYLSLRKTNEEVSLSRAYIDEHLLRINADSQPPVSQPPVSQPPVSQPPVSQPPATTVSGPYREYQFDTNNQDYKKVGYVTYTDTLNEVKRLPLFEKRRYEKYYYYIVDSTRNFNQIPYSSNRKEQLYDKDVINVPELSSTVTVTIYKYHENYGYE